jgi:predicted Zn-dependent protease
MRLILKQLFALLLLAGALAGCAANPVTGESDFVLMTEDEEIAIGRENHPKILEKYGRYDAPGLQAYVQQVCDRLGANSHRANLIYRCTVLDSDEVNAFALPGGYVYITRGLLAYLNSEAELAAVLGHEIGHVTARHAVRQQSAATATGILASVIAAGTGVQGSGDLLNVIGTAIVRGYGREHELESDRLGAEYLARTGYDPNAMLDVIGVLKNQEEFEKQRAKEEDREPHIYHGVFATHPDNDTRLQQVVGSAGKLRQPNGSRRSRDEFLDQLNGLVFGDSAREGVRRGNAFYHEPLGIALEFPQGWRLENQPDRLVAIAPGGGGSMQVSVADLNRRYSPREYLEKRLKLDDMQHGEAIQQYSMQGYTAIAESKTPYGTRPTRFVVLFRKDKAWVFVGATKNEEDPYKYDRAILNTARTFHELTAEERELARPQRIKVITADAHTRYSELAMRSRIPNHAEVQLRLLNRHYPEGEPVPGSRIKIVD